MPSIEHDTLKVLFLERPEFAVEVLRDLLGADLAGDIPVHVAGNEFNDRSSTDSQADTVIIQGYRDQPDHGIIVEIQREKSEEKQEQWSRYAASLWLALRCPVSVIVVCPRAGVASWAMQPIITKLPGYTLTPWVLGPDQIPVITDPAQVRAQPALASMSVMAHGEDRRVTEAFAAGLASLDADHALQYSEYAYKLASQAARRILEELMASTAWPVFSPFAKKHYGKGHEEGREEGREVGLAEGEARAVLAVLETRGIEVTPAAREQITGCTDAAQLTEWVRRSVTAVTVDDLFVAEA